MKRWRIPLALVLALLSGSLLIWIRTDAFAERFGPMREVESQCLLCNRSRNEKWLSTRKVVDQELETDCSRWVNTVFDPRHEHVWLAHTRYERSRWFGSKSIGCGGVRTAYQIFDHRRTFDADEMREMFAELNQVVGKMPPFDLKPLDEFSKRVEERAKAKASSD